VSPLLSTILRRFPVSQAERLVAVAGDATRVRSRFKAYEIFVWAKIGLPHKEPDADASCFPILIDTGNNHNLLLQDQQLLKLANCHPAWFPRCGHTKLLGCKTPLLDASLWLYPNVPNSWECDFNAQATELELDNGAAVIHTGTVNPPWKPSRKDCDAFLLKDYPRVPTLGLRALFHNRLCFYLDNDGEDKHAFLGRRRPWWRMFG
jgi:hypothetical protein